jgi:hypothetical protein
MITSLVKITLYSSYRVATARAIGLRIWRTHHHERSPGANGSTDGQINASIVVLEAGQGGRFWKGRSGKEIGCRLPQSIGLLWNINASIYIDLQSA